MTPREQIAVDRLADLARDASPPPLDEDAARRMVRDAAMQGRARRRRRAAARSTAYLAAAAVALLAAGGALLLRDEGAATVAVDQAEPLRMALPTGDRITAAPGSHFRLESTEARARRVSLEDGTVLFDVAKLEDGTSFEVVTPHLTTRVRGTVFSVQATAEGTVVRVFEGVVEVDDRDGDAPAAPTRRRLVRAEQATRSGTPSVDSLDEGSPLAEEAWRAAAARGAEVPAQDAADDTEAQTPEPEPVAEQEPAPEPEAATGSADRLAHVREPADARRLITRGDPRGALEAARTRARHHHGPDRARWRVVEGDAERALRRWEHAARAYERAVPALPRTEAVRAGYTAASIRFHRLDDPAGALAALERSAADTDGSVLEERALALRARALHRTGRTEEARAAATRYLERFPEGGMAEWMGALEGEPSRP